MDSQLTVLITKLIFFTVQDMQHKNASKQLGLEFPLLDEESIKTKSYREAFELCHLLNVPNLKFIALIE